MSLERIPLLGGMYEARSVIASAQRCVNLYPEKNAQDAPFPFTNYLTPGLTQLIAGIGAPHRCAYTASTGNLYEVIGDNVYATSANWVRTKIGSVTAGLTTPVYISDNGIVGLIVDGTSNGYCFDFNY